MESEGSCQPLVKVCCLSMAAHPAGLEDTCLEHLVGPKGAWETASWCKLPLLFFSRNVRFFRWNWITNRTSSSDILFVPTLKVPLNAGAPDLCPSPCKTTGMICWSTEKTAGQHITTVGCASHLGRFPSKQKAEVTEAQNRQEPQERALHFPTVACGITLHYFKHMFWFIWTLSISVRFSIYHRYIWNVLFK